MAQAPKRKCPIPQCPHLQPCPIHTPASRRTPRSKEGQALYNSPRWKRYRPWFLSEHPLCVDPYGRHKGSVVPATVVDHIKPHGNDYDSFHDEANHQALCASCHSFKIAKYDGGFGNPWGEGKL